MEILREFRKKANISQRVMAEILKTTESQIAMAELGERLLPRQSMKLFELIQAMPDDVDVMCSNGNPLPEKQVVLANEAVRTWQEKAAQNKWQLHSLKKKLAKMKAAFELTYCTADAISKGTVAILQSGANDIEVDYFKEKQKSVNRKILPFGPISIVLT